MFEQLKRIPKKKLGEVPTALDVFFFILTLQKNSTEQLLKTLS